MVIHENENKAIRDLMLMNNLQKKCPCFKSALKAYVKWFLFSSEIMNGNREQQETLLNHLQIEDTRLFQLIYKIKSLLDETGRLRSMQDRNTLVKLEIKDDLCYFTIGDDTIKIGVVKTDEEDKLTLYKDVFPINLFIFAIQEEMVECKFHIYDFERLELYPSVVKFEKLEPAKNELIGYLNTQRLTKDSATKIGKELYNKLIPGELSVKLKSKLDKFEQWVCIYCDDKRFDPIWEWLYTKEEGFFWGDRFYIVRIPESLKEGAAPPPFKIENIAILKGRGRPLILNDSSCLKDLCKAIYHEDIGLEDSDRLKNLDVFDGIHVVATSDTFVKQLYKHKYIKSITRALSYKRQANRSNDNATKYLFNFSELVSNKNEQEKLLKHLQTISPYLSQLIENVEYSPDGVEGIKLIKNGKTIARLEIKNGCCYLFYNEDREKLKIGLVIPEPESGELKICVKNTPTFLFLNTCGCNKDIQSQIRQLISADMWIDTSFEVTEEFASIFAKEFYEEFCTGKSAVEAVTKAREKIGNKNILRFVYVVRGNPYARV